MKKHNTSRRDFFKVSTIPLLAAVGNFSPVSAATNTHKNIAHDASMPKLYQAKKFFTNDRAFRVLNEAVERIFPEDELGAGAKKLGVAYFIDGQLAGGYGICEREYMMGPFEQGDETQGYQAALNRRQIFEMGIAALDEEAKIRFKKGFVEISDSQKDEILSAFEKNKSKVEFEGITSADFFSDLRTMTLAGVYSDPIYGGNANMQAWKMKNFPGAQMTYSAYVENDKLDVIEPVSLADMSH